MNNMVRCGLPLLIATFAGLAAADDVGMPPLLPATPPKVQPAAQPTHGLQRQGLTFLDSKLFDSRLSQELGAGKDKVDVEISGKVTLSNIPDRLDRWITRVGEGGSVEVREGPARTRSIFGLLPMIFSAFEHASEERMLEPAKNYNATILYRRDDNGDSVIERIVFTRKKPQ
jgi:hypothetical protein